MIRVGQDRFGEDGNCFEACVASIFELDEIPDFGKDDMWWIRFVHFLRPLGLSALNVAHNKDWDGGDIKTWMEETLGGGILHIISGQSKRGLLHAVVGMDGKMVWDPHPTHSGLISIEEFTFIIAPNPMMIERKK